MRASHVHVQCYLMRALQQASTHRLALVIVLPAQLQRLGDERVERWRRVGAYALRLPNPVNLPRSLEASTLALGRRAQLLSRWLRAAAGKLLRL